MCIRDRVSTQSTWGFRPKTGDFFLFGQVLSFHTLWDAGATVRNQPARRVSVDRLASGLKWPQLGFVKAKVARCSIGQITLQAQADTAKGQTFPGDFRRGKKCHLQAFVARRIVWPFQASPVKKMNLIDVRNADQGKRCINENVGACFFLCFTNRSLCRGFSVLHEAGRQCPKTVAWLDCAPAEQDAIFPLGNAANDQAWVLIVNMSAGVADVPGERVTVRSDKRNTRTAAVAILDHGDFGQKLDPCTLR
eukprot:TRINITY_DN1560_c0_g1_i1.p1 TRINITY_DN1560_c0_g1~~TRINITY_DN1560_c0_g1_i1.p1  ORF type:complete len:250 (-),score=-9.30 TRINITY_DN1560_c0_g1_i1:5-754(-)